jgi:sugar/nucleoside kinase (ribokinase family)
MIASIGDLLLDIMITARKQSDGMPEGIYLRPGGSAANVAAWAVRSGAEASWLGVVGSDTAGDFLLADLERAGVYPSVTKLDGVETGIVISRLGSRGERHMHSARLASSRLRREHLSESVIRSAAAVHATGYAMNSAEGFRAVEWALRLASKSGAFTSVDPSTKGIVNAIGRERFLEFLEASRVSAVFANRTEAQAISNVAGARRSAEVLSGHVPLAIVKDGARGSYVHSGSGVHFTPAIPAVAVDTTGAGDAFAGGFLAAYLESCNLERASREATVAASRAIEAVGARPVEEGSES